MTGGNDREALLDAGFAGARDPVYFAEQIIGVDLNPAQKRWFEVIKPDEQGHWPYKLILHVAGNQTGKTLGAALVILWACINKIGVPTGDSDRWLRAPYTWAHVAPTQQQAYIAFRDISLLIKGAHPAQVRPCKLVAPLVKEIKVEGYYSGYEFISGAIAQFRTTEDKADALQGRRFDGITFDEAAFENHLRLIVNEVLMMRLVASGGPLFLSSTPSGINDFWEFIQPVLETGTEVAERTWIKPGEAALVWSHVSDNVGYGLDQVEIDRMERDLDETTKEQQLRGAFLEPAEAFFSPPSEALKAFADLPEVIPPQEGHRYTIFWDPSVAVDPLAAVVLDVTDPIWQGVHFTYHKKPPSIEKTIVDIFALHALYNSNGASAITGYDSTSMGGQMLVQMLSRITPSRPLNLAGPSMKIDVMSNCRLALMSHKVLLPNAWVRLKREILNYKLADTKIAQDAVVAFAGAVHLASSGFSGVMRRPFSVSGRVSQAPWR